MRLHQLSDGTLGCVAVEAGCQRRCAQRAQLAQQIGNALFVAGPVARGEALQLFRHLGRHPGVQQFAHIGLAKQLAQQAAVERQQRGAPLRQRRIGGVDKLCHVTEQQGRGERRRRLGRHLGKLHAAVLNARHQLMQRRQIVHILQTLARRLDQNGKVGIIARYRQQLAGAQTLLPERRALARITARQQQGARRAFAETRGKQRRMTDGFGDLARQGIGVELKQLGAWHASLHIGKARDNAVIARHDRGIQAHPAAYTRRDRQRPGRVHALAPRRMKNNAPVAGLIAAALDQQRGVGRQQTCRLALFRYQRLKIMLRAGIEPRYQADLAGLLLPIQLA